jgi:hypothetical protein
MLHKATLEYTEPLLRQAVHAFWRRTVGLGFFVSLVLLMCSLTFLIWCGDRSWRVGALGAVLLFGLAFVSLLYLVHLRNTLAKLRAMSSTNAAMALSEASITMSSDLGITTLQWSTVTAVWRYPSFWLLLFSRAQFVTLPLASISAEAQAFIVRRVSETGGKVVG